MKIEGLMKFNNTLKMRFKSRVKKSDLKVALNGVYCEEKVILKQS